VRARQPRRRPFGGVLDGTLDIGKQGIAKGAGVRTEAKGDRGSGRVDARPEERGSETARAETDDEGEAPQLAAFTPPPPVLGHLSRPTADPAAALGSPAQVLAEVAAMAERMVTSMSIGRIGQNGHALRMKLSLGRGSTARVDLRLHDDELEVDLETDGATAAEARALERALEERLGVSVSLR